MAKNTSSSKRTSAGQSQKQGTLQNFRDKQRGRANKQSFVYSFFKHTRLQAFLLFFLSLILYAPSIRYGYVLDDSLVISQNTFVRQGIAGIPSILSQGSFAGNTEVGTEDILSGGRYRPLSLVMFAVEWQLGGGSPVLSHAVNIILHAVIVLLIFHLVQWLVRWQHLWANTSASMSVNMASILSPVFPFCVALLFAVHPIHVEVVANIKSRDELLSLLFSLIALVGFVRVIVAKSYQTEEYLQKSISITRWRAVFICIGAFVLALFSKENALTMLAVLPLTAWLLVAIAKSDADNTGGFTQTKQFISTRHFVFMMITLLAIAAIFLTVRTLIVGFVDERAGDDIFSNPFWNANTSERYGLIMTVLLRYVVLMVFPWTLAHDYGYNTIPRQGIWHWQSITAFVVYGVMVVTPIVGMTVRRRLLKKQQYVEASTTLIYRPLSLLLVMSEPVFIYGIGWYVATLSIVSNIVVNIGGLVGERFLYMPSVGGCFVMAWLLLRLTKRSESLFAKRDDGREAFGVILILIVSVMFAVRLIVRLPAWESTVALLRADAHSVPMNLKVRDRAAIALLAVASTESNVQQRTKMVEEAYQHIQTALSINDTISPVTYNALADYYSRYRQRSDSAIVCYERALRIKPNDRNTLCNLYNERAAWALEQGSVDSALVLFNKALHYDNGLSAERTATMLSNIGVLYLQQQRLDSAEVFLRRALKVDKLSGVLQQGIEQVLRQVLQEQAKSK